MKRILWGVPVGIAVGLVLVLVFPPAARAAIAPAAPLPPAPAPVYAASGQSALAAAQMIGTRAIPVVAASTVTMNGAIPVLGGGVLGFALGSGISQVVWGVQESLGGEGLDDVLCTSDGAQWLGVLYGQNCDAYLANAIPPEDANLDATARPPGWYEYPFRGPFGPGTAVVAEGGLTATQTGSWRWSASGFTTTTGAGNASWTYWCRATAGGAFTRVPQSNVPFWPAHGPGTVTTIPLSWSCAAGSTLYAVFAYGIVVTTNPESAFAAASASDKERYWFAEGSVYWTPGTTSNPERVLRTTVTYTDATSSTCDSAPFTELDEWMPQPCIPGLVPGKIPAEWRIDIVGPGLDPKTIYEQEITDAYAEVVTEYPACALGECVVQVAIGTQLCTVGAPACLDWQTQEDAACIYGPSGDPDLYVLDLPGCYHLVDYYKPEAQVQGRPYTDPSTGTRLDQQTAQSLDDAYRNDTVPNLTLAGRFDLCLGNGWNAPNPIEWVMRPVQCALEWAFAPREAAVQTQLQRVVTATETSVFADVATAAATVPWVGGLDASGDCNGPPVTFGPPLDQLGIAGTYYPLSACSEPMATFATISWLASGAFMAITGVLALSRYVSGTVGFPGLGRSDE